MLPQNVKLLWSLQFDWLIDQDRLMDTRLNVTEALILMKLWLHDYDYRIASEKDLKWVCIWWSYGDFSKSVKDIASWNGAKKSSIWRIKPKWSWKIISLPVISNQHFDIAIIQVHNYYCFSTSERCFKICLKLIYQTCTTIQTMNCYFSNKCHFK